MPLLAAITALDVPQTVMRCDDVPPTKRRNSLPSSCRQPLNEISGTSTADADASCEPFETETRRVCGIALHAVSHRRRRWRCGSRRWRWRRARYRSGNRDRSRLALSGDVAVIVALPTATPVIRPPLEIIDGDLQDPPELIPELIETLARGRGHRRRQAPQPQRRDAASSSPPRAGSTRIMGRLAQVDLEPNAGVFGLIDRAVDRLTSTSYTSATAPSPGSASGSGSRQGSVEYDRQSAPPGKPKQTFRRLMKGYAMDGMGSALGLQHQLRAATWLGFACAALALLATAAVLHRPPGASSSRGPRRHRLHHPADRGAVPRRHAAHRYRHDRRVRRPHLRRGQQRPLYVVASQDRQLRPAPPPRAGPRPPPVRIAIVGAGVTGLVPAGRLLGRAGHQVTTSTSAGPVSAGRPRPSTSAKVTCSSATTTTGSRATATSPGSTTSSGCPASSSGGRPRWRSSSRAARGRSRRRCTCCASARCRRSRACAWGWRC